MSNTEVVRCLVRNHQDTKIVLYYNYAIVGDYVIVRSPSGGAYIMALVIALLHDKRERNTLDNGVSAGRKVIWLGTIQLSLERRNLMLGFHGFTGIDYASYFFIKSKKPVERR